MKLTVDTVTETKSKYVAYVHVTDDEGNILGTVAAEFSDKDDLKNKIRDKITAIRNAHSTVEERKAVACEAAAELEIEINATLVPEKPVSDPVPPDVSV